MLSASFDTKCFIFSIEIFSHLKPSLVHRLTASCFLVWELYSLIVFDPQDGHFRGKTNFFDSFFLLDRSTEITWGITSPALSIFTVSPTLISFLIRKDIRVGDTVKIERAGDVIPHVISVDLSKRKKESKKFVFPLKCPSCGSKTIKEYNSQTKKHDAVRRCTSEGFKCEKISIEKIKHFVSKDALNIDGFGKKIVQNFWEIGLIKLPPVSYTHLTLPTMDHV